MSNGLKISSNIDKVLKSFGKKYKAIKTTLENIAEKLAERMSEDMKNEIVSHRSTWAEKGSMDYIDQINFDIVKTGNNSVRVSIGENLPKHEMTDGTLVNPVYFIEFGFGIVGEAKPKKNAELYDWEYNINDHQDAWVFFGRDEKFHTTKGREGLNFLYKTMLDYKERWKDYIIDMIKGNENG